MIQKVLCKTLFDIKKMAPYDWIGLQSDLNDKVHFNLNLKINKQNKSVYNERKI